MKRQDLREAFLHLLVRLVAVSGLWHARALRGAAFTLSRSLARSSRRQPRAIRAASRGTHRGVLQLVEIVCAVRNARLLGSHRAAGTAAGDYCHAAVVPAVSGADRCSGRAGPHGRARRSQRRSQVGGTSRSLPRVSARACVCLSERRGGQRGRRRCGLDDPPSCCSGSHLAAVADTRARMLARGGAGCGVGPTFFLALVGCMSAATFRSQGRGCQRRAVILVFSLAFETCGLYHAA